MSFLIRELLLEDGESPFSTWFDALDATAAAKVRVALGRMEQGNLSNVAWFRGIGECKIDWTSADHGTHPRLQGHRRRARRA